MMDQPLSDATAWPMPPAPGPVPGNTDEGSIFGPHHLTRIGILAATGVFLAVFGYAAHWLHWPAELYHGGSLAQSGTVLTFVAVLLLLVACAGLGTFLLARGWFMGGLMAATAGLTLWSSRGGSMAQVLFNANSLGQGRAVFIMLTGELIVLYGVIGAMWLLIWRVPGPSVQGSDQPGHDTVETDPERVPWYVDGPFGAVLVQTVVMLVCSLMLSVTPVKKQVLAAVFISGLLGTAAAQTFAKRSAGRWYWLAPLIVGTIGYLTAYLYPAGMETGDLHEAFGPLARALPLDYASLGCAGVLFGYWWNEPEAEDPHVTPENQSPAPASE